MEAGPGRQPFHYWQMILTLWQESGRGQTGQSCWRLSLQNPYTQERTGFREIEDLATFLAAWMEEQSAQQDT